MDYRDVEQLIDRERGLGARVRGLSRPARLGLAAGVLIAFGIAVALLLPRMDMPYYPQGRLSLGVLVLGAVGLVAVWQALRPLYRPPLPGWVPAATFAAALALLGVWAALPELPTMGVPDPTRPGWMGHCLASGALAGTALVFLVRSLDRGGRTGLDMAAYGAVFGGLAANVGLVLSCPINAPVHLFLGHATVPLALIGLFAIGTSAIRRRPATPRRPPPETPSPP